MNISQNDTPAPSPKRKLPFHRLPPKLIKPLLQLLTVLLLIGAGAFGIRKYITYESQATKIGFEDLGEFVTQAAYCTEVQVTDASRKLFNKIDIPFTQSKYIYSYDVILKAGFDFSKIQWDVKGSTITVKLPEAKIISSEVDTESFKVYHEQESIFNQIRLEENNEALTQLKQDAEKEAVANGLLDNARTNAESLLTGFFGKVYNLQKYTITFKDL